MSRKLFIVINAGHGGVINNIPQTAGKRSPDGSFIEGTFNRIMSKKVSQALTDKGIENKCIIETEEDVRLSKRCAIANQLKKTYPDMLYLSIHANASGDSWSSATGVEVFTSTGETLSDLYAAWIVAQLAASDAIKIQSRMRYADDGSPDKEENFFELVNTSMPAVLVECGFYTNKEEVKLLSDEEFQWSEARAIAEGIRVAWEAILKNY